jgi:hypothetical protein
LENQLRNIHTSSDRKGNINVRAVKGRVARKSDAVQRLQYVPVEGHRKFDAAMKIELYNIGRYESAGIETQSVFFYKSM